MGLIKRLQDGVPDADATVHGPSIAKVIATFGGSRRSVPKTPEETTALLKVNYANELSVPSGTLLAGMDRGYKLDVYYIVNEACENVLAYCPEYVEFLGRINGTPTPSGGRFRVIRRPNIGLSYCGFWDFIYSYGGLYDYFVLTEDDHITFHHQYLPLAIKQLDEDPSIGAVALYGVADAGDWLCGAAGVYRRRDWAEYARNIDEAPVYLHPGYSGHTDHNGFKTSEETEVRFTRDFLACIRKRCVDVHMTKCLTDFRKERTYHRCMPWSEARNELLDRIGEAYSEAGKVDGHRMWPNFRLMDSETVQATLKLDSAE